MPAAAGTVSRDVALLHEAGVPVGWMSELWSLATLAVPTISVTTVGSRLVHACVAQAVIGKCWGKMEQAAAGFAIAIYIPLTVAPTGLVATLGVLSSQAIGAGNVALAGEWLLVAAMVLLIIGVCCVAFCIVLTPMFIELSIPDSTIQHMAADFTFIFAWSGIIFQLFQMMRAWFGSQGVVMPFTVATVLGLGCTVGIGILLACQSESIQWTGASVAVDCAGLAQLVLIFLWSLLAQGVHRTAWATANWRSAFARGRILEVMRQGGYRGLWLVLDESACLLVTLMTGRLGTAEVATQSVYFLLWSVAFAIQIGLGFSVSTRVGLYLGAGKGWSARRAAMVGLIMFIGKAVLFNLIILSFSPQLSRLFSSDIQVQLLLQQNMLGLTLCIAATALAQGTAAALDGAAAVRSLAAIVATGSWCIGLPMSAMLGFGPPALRLRGVWLGLASGESAKAVIALIVLSRFDWLEAAAAAQQCSGVAELESCSTNDLPGDTPNACLNENSHNGTVP